MPTNYYAGYTTEAILTAITDEAWLDFGQAMAELKARVVKSGDADDQPNMRGGIRPGHAPVAP